MYIYIFYRRHFQLGLSLSFIITPILISPAGTSPQTKYGVNRQVNELLLLLLISLNFRQLKKSRGCVTLILSIGRMPWPKTGTTHYHAKLGHPDKGCAIKALVVCYVVWLGSMKSMGFRTSARCLGLVPCCSQVPQRNSIRSVHLLIANVCKSQFMHAKIVLSILSQV